VSRYRIAAPVADYAGRVGEYSFTNGQYEGELTDGALTYFRTAGYAVEDLSVDPDGPGGLPPKAALRAEWEQAGRDLGLSDEDIAACSNKDQLIDLVTTQHEAKAADATAAEADPTAGAHAAADDTQNGATP
jgi:hypothetical protein